MLRGLILFLILSIHSANSLWNFAVTTKNKILFYDDKWALVKTSAHQFEELSALTFDEVEEKIYFSDKMHNNGSIFSLKIQLDNIIADIIQNVIMRTDNEKISGIAYDPLDRNLFWTDARNKKIFRRSIDSIWNNKSEVIVDLANSDDVPDGIAIDICRRKLYWSNSNYKNASIEQSDLDGLNKMTIITSNLYLPHGLFVDQISNRLYYVVDQQGIHYSVESTNLDGTDRQVIVAGLNNVPYSLIVTQNTIFWTDQSHNAIWSVNKMPQIGNEDNHPTKVQLFETQPIGIVHRQEFLSKMSTDEHCSAIIKQLKSKLLEDYPSAPLIQVQKDHFCLNSAEYNAISGTCICRPGFTGMRCDTRECHNFCVHGTCSTSEIGFPKCTCQLGFTGERCELFSCSGYCLNGGKCSIVNGQATCDCLDEFSGSRCETNSTELCPLFCKMLTYNIETPIPNGCHDVCDRLSSIDDEILRLAKVKHLKLYDSCSNGLVFITIMVVGGVIVALILVLAIVLIIRRIYKPVRPRIKKTFIFKKKDTHTPLTSRPAEQCEITIENCCNLQICETPCFDPKLLQQSLSTKEDKKTLINNMEDDLY